MDIFEINNAFATSTIGVYFSPEMLTDMIGYVSAIFSDLSGLILLILGVLLGVFVITAIISAVRS